jgi:hypothetical protein
MEENYKAKEEIYHLRPEQVDLIVRGNSIAQYYGSEILDLIGFCAIFRQE